MFKCVVVDDQKEAIFLLERHIRQIPDLLMVFSTTNPLEAINFIKNEKVQLVFLDIEMPNFSGLDFIASIKEAIGEDTPKIIFTTGYEKYAVNGYEHNILDFLLKPISFPRFQLGLERFFKIMQQTEVKDARDFIFIEAGGKKIKLQLTDLLFIEADRSYLEVYTSSLGKLLLVNKPLSFFEELLSKNDSFLRINRSYLINVQKIVAIKGNVITINLNGKEQEYPIGKTYKNAVYKKLNLNNN